MYQKEPDKATQVCTTVQISITRPEDSIIRNKAFILTWIDFTYV